MEKKITLNGQNIPISNCIISMYFDANNIKNQTSKENFNFMEQMDNLYENMYLLKIFLQNPQFINNMNFKLFIQLLNNIPNNDNSVESAISLLEIYINNINKFNPDLTDNILQKIISKLCYTNGIINGNEELYMTSIMDSYATEIININTVFKSIILPLIVSNNVELMKKITNTIFQHSQKEFCFLFIRTCIEFYDMIPQAFLHEMFGIGKQNEVHNTIKEFIINDLQNVIIALSNYNNIDFILMYLNEIIRESNNVVLDSLINTNKNILSYNVIHHYSTTRHTINIKEIKNTGLKIFIQNLINGIIQPIQIVPTNLGNKKLQNILSNFNNIINGRTQLYNIQNYIEEITILSEYINIDYILLELYKANFIHRELVTFAINLFLTKYDKIQSIELKQLYIELIQQKHLYFDNVSSFTNNYDKFDNYLKSGIQKKFNNLAIKLFSPAYALECIPLLCLLEKIHRDKVDEILLPIFIKNSEYLNGKQKAFIKEYIFANIFRNEIRPINMCFDIQDINGNTVLKYEIQSVKKINKLALIECLDIFYNNIENYCETKEGNEAIIIANLPHIIGIIDNLECNIEDKLELKTKIFLDVQKMLKNSNIEIFDDKNEAIEFLLTEIKKESIKNPEIVSYFFADTEKEKTTKNRMTFFDSNTLLAIPSKTPNKKDKGFIFNVLLLAEKQDKIKIQQSFMNYLDINLKKGNTGLLELYCDNIEKFDKEFGQIIFYKALEYGTLSLNIESLKHNISK